MLLLPQLLVSRAQTGRRGNISYAEVIEALLTAGFHFIGLRMVLLGVVEAADCAKLYSGCLPEDWKPHHLVGIFVILDNSYLFYVNFFNFVRALGLDHVHGLCLRITLSFYPRAF